MLSLSYNLLNESTLRPGEQHCLALHLSQLNKRTKMALKNNICEIIAVIVTFELKSAYLLRRPWMDSELLLF